MSAKSLEFLPPHIREARKAAEAARKTGSYAPPPYQVPARQPIAGPTERHLAGLIPSEASGRRAPPVLPRPTPATAQQTSVLVPLSLREAVAAVSAFLSASDHTLVQSARYETLGDLDTASRLYERSLMLEGMAERVARVSRNIG